jgi:hypothetical protein
MDDTCNCRGTSNYVGSCPYCDPPRCPYCGRILRPYDPYPIYPYYPQTSWPYPWPRITWWCGTSSVSDTGDYTIS